MEKKIDLRIIKTYDKLMHALCDMMQEMPFENITVFDLCERADIRRATFYKHFEDKYAFLSYVIEKTLSGVSEKILNEKNVSSLSEYLTLYVEKIIDYFDQKQMLLQNILARGSFSVLFEAVSTNTLKSLIRNLSQFRSDLLDSSADNKNLLASFVNGGLATIVFGYISAPYMPKDQFLREVRKTLDRIM